MACLFTRQLPRTLSRTVPVYRQHFRSFTTTVAKMTAPGARVATIDASNFHSQVDPDADGQL